MLHEILSFCKDSFDFETVLDAFLEEQAFFHMQKKEDLLYTSYEIKITSCLIEDAYKVITENNGFSVDIEIFECYKLMHQDKFIANS